jgi:hypothetical protein
MSDQVQSVNVDVRQLAQALIDKYNAEAASNAAQLQGKILGVNELYERIMEAVKQLAPAPAAADAPAADSSEPAGPAPEASPEAPSAVAGS